MSFTMEEHLESGWVAVRPHVFEEKEKHKFVFIVAWNAVEGKFAITCHNRTAQRRSLARDSFVDLAGQEENMKRPQSPVQDQAAGSPGRGAVGPEMKEVLPPISPDPEALEALREEEPLSPLGEHSDLEELDGLSREDCSWAGLFSFQDLRTIHFQLCSVNSDLEPCLPIFPEEPAGMWAVLFGTSPVPQVEMDQLCYRLHVYLGHALDTCSWKILSQVLFTENDDPDEYYESLSELRQSGYEEAVGRTKRRLDELLEQHRSMESMVDLLAVYEEEDQAYGNLLEASTQLYQYLLQPFRDMRELAMLRRQQIKISLENDYLGPRRVKALQKEDSDWQKKAQEAVLNIQEFTVRYFEITAKAQKGVYERMRTDQRKFGKAAWAAAVERMETVRYSVAKETLQLQRAREICLEQSKHTLREEMQRLRGGADALARLDRLEGRYHGLQLRLYDARADVLQCEELLLNAQLARLHRQMTERQDEVVYYDTFECPEAIGEVEAVAPEELRRLRASARQLEARRGRIGTKRTYLKNKREVCVSSHSEKQRRRRAGQTHSPSRPLPQTDDEEEEEEEKEEDEEGRRSRVSQQRQTTLDRLRSFKQRYPGQVILKSTRLRGVHGRRRERGGPRDPPRLSTSVQTDPPLGAALTTQPPPSSFSSSSSSSVPPPHRPDAPGPLDLSCSPCSLLAPPAPPRPPPPPPPLPLPLPPGREEQPGRGGGGGSPLGPFVPRFFDSSQLVGARRRLRKIPELDPDSRPGSSPMDEVLASLKRGCFHLRRVEQRGPPPPPGAGADDDAGSILAQIRRGVTLRRVPRPQRREHGTPPPPSDPLARSIHEALRRIKDASPDSESDDDDGGMACPDWES